MARKDSDEAYVIDMVDAILGCRGDRQRRFDFLRGDPGKTGRCSRLPVDVFYPGLMLAVEFREIQHHKPIAHFDKPYRITVSGVHRGEQRKIYDQRRRDVLPENGITLLQLDHSIFACTSNGRLRRVEPDDAAAIVSALKSVGMECRGKQQQAELRMRADG